MPTESPEYPLLDGLLAAVAPFVAGALESERRVREGSAPYSTIVRVHLEPLRVDVACYRAPAVTKTITRDANQQIVSVDEQTRGASTTLWRSPLSPPDDPAHRELADLAAAFLAEGMERLPATRRTRALQAIEAGDADLIVVVDVAINSVGGALIAHDNDQAEPELLFVSRRPRDETD